ncbi:MAG: hypothetical protein M9899_09525 [Bdellovibrionaceae bacterium]|nr:hypothetical protein [Pseudobdellovibrionaceae bacterium]
MNFFIRVVVLVVVLLSGVFASAAPLVLGKRYPLNTKAERGTLVWQFVTFNRSISGGINIQLEVYNSRAKSLKYFDEYREIVDSSIQKNTVSKFALENSSVNFSSDRYALLTFQVSKLSNLYYIPLRVDYYDGFEDYLVRLYFAKGKFSMASRLLQQGKFVNADETAESQEDNKKSKKKSKKDKKKKSEEQEPSDQGMTFSPQEAPAESVDTGAAADSTSPSEPSVDEEHTILVEPIELTPEEQKEQDRVNEELRSFIETAPDETLLQELPEFKSDLSDPNFKDASDILFGEKPDAPKSDEASSDANSETTPSQDETEEVAP